jgi:hypothetical protein
MPFTPTLGIKPRTLRQRQSAGGYTSTQTLELKLKEEDSVTSRPRPEKFTHTVIWAVTSPMSRRSRQSSLGRREAKLRVCRGAVLPPDAVVCDVMFSYRTT